MSAGLSLEQTLDSGAAALGLDLSKGQQKQLLDYLALLAKWNAVYNLTALRDPAQMMTHHLLDSLAVVAPLRRHTGSKPVRLLDVGSGGGLPGVVLAICCPEIEVSCLDAVAKKAAFVQQVAGVLGLPNIKSIHGRIEKTANQFDVVMSRAFATLVDFVVGSRQTLTPDGVWMAMKGKRPNDEIAALPVGVKVFHVEPLTVPQLDADRCLVWMRPSGN